MSQETLSTVNREQILSYLGYVDKASVICTLFFGTCSIVLPTHEAIVLLRCMDAESLAQPYYRGPKLVELMFGDEEYNDLDELEFRWEAENVA